MGAYFREGVIFGGAYLAGVKRRATRSAVLHGSSSTWCQTSCYCRAEINSKIIKTV